MGDALRALVDTAILADAAAQLVARLKTLPRSDVNTFLDQFKVQRVRDLRKSDVEAARQLMYHSATLMDNGERADKEASMAKLFASEMVNRITGKALQIHGGYGFMSEYEIDRVAQRLKGFHGRSPAPLLNGLCYLFVEPGHTFTTFMDRIDVLLKGNLLGRMVHFKFGQPIKVGFCPFLLAMIDTLVS